MAQAARVAPPTECAELVNAGFQYVDVRTPQEFEAGHPPGSVNVPFMLKDPSGAMAPNPGFLQEFSTKFGDKSEQLVVGCQSGRRSAAACSVLSQAGYNALVDNGGGFGGWQQAGLPVEK